MTTNQIIASKTAAAKEQQLRETIAALPADYLARIGLGSQAAIDAYVAAEMEGEA
jgi:hypothetical protein